MLPFESLSFEDQWDDTDRTKNMYVMWFNCKAKEGYTKVKRKNNTWICMQLLEKD